jgi:ubiquinone/menaquinone biosynthesis C-methylase UbiE
LVTRLQHVFERYDRWASSYDESPLRPAFEAGHTAVLRTMGRLSVRPGRILDVGCGTGLLLRRVSLMFPGATLVGLDVSAGMLAAAGRATASARVMLVQAGAERLPFADATFDVVLATMSVRHWSDEAAGLAEIGRVLAPGGLFGLADVPTGTRLDGPMWRWRLRRTAVVVSLKEVGLAVVDVRMVHGYGPVPAVTVTFARRPATASTRPTRVGR